MSVTLISWDLASQQISKGGASEAEFCESLRDNIRCVGVCPQEARFYIEGYEKNHSSRQDKSRTARLSKRTLYNQVAMS